MKRFVSEIMELNAALRGFFKKTIELKGWKLVWFYCKTLGYHFLWSFIVGVTLYLCGVKFSQHVASSSEFVGSFLLVPMCALLEEMLFRWGPMLLFIGGLGYFSRVMKIDDESKSMIENNGIVGIKYNLWACTWKCLQYCPSRGEWINLLYVLLEKNV